jgi:purine-binding chemotaxis protein CheW
VLTTVDTVLIPVGEDLFAIPIGWVREVVTAPLLTGLVTAPVMVLGLFNLRGEIVPLLDTASLLGLGSVGDVVFALVLQTHLGPVGLSASAFPKRAFLDEPLGPSELACSSGSYRVGQHVAVLLDIQALLDSPALSTLDRAGEPDVHSAAYAEPV